MTGDHSDEPWELAALLPLALRARRRELRVDQRAFAAGCGVSKSVVARLEKGDVGVSARTLLRVLGAGGLELCLVHADGRRWRLHEALAPDLDDGRDAAGRRLPGHLPSSFGNQLQSWDVTRRRDQLMSTAPRWRYDRWQDQVDTLVGEVAEVGEVADVAEVGGTAREPRQAPSTRGAAADAVRAPSRPSGRVRRPH
jgi:transcriptional regulator with XRE-family HTH domain